MNMQILIILDEFTALCGKLVSVIPSSLLSAMQVLDEPASRQSDPTVLTLQLRNLSKEATGNKTDMVGRIDHLDEGKAKKVQVCYGIEAPTVLLWSLL